MTTFIYIQLLAEGLEQVWACHDCICISYLEMIKAPFLIGLHFLGFDIIKNINNVVSGNPKRQNDVIKEKIDESADPQWI